MSCNPHIFMPGFSAEQTASLQAMISASVSDDVEQSQQSQQSQQLLPQHSKSDFAQILPCRWHWKNDWSGLAEFEDESSLGSFE